MTTLLNTAILLLSLTATWLLLWSAGHLSLGYALLAAWLFSLVNNTPFALMHEAVHGIASRSPRLNRLLGVVAGNLVYPVAPWVYRSRFFASALGFGPYVADLVKPPAATRLRWPSATRPCCFTGWT